VASEHARPGRSPARGVAGALCGLAFAAALLWPQVDREALVAQGLAHLLGDDVERSLAGEGGPSLFGALAEVASAPEPPAAARVGIFVDGALRRGPRLERAVATQWNRFRAQSRLSLPELTFADAPGAADLSLWLRIDTAGNRVDLSAEIAYAGRRRALTAPAGWPLPDRASLLPPLLAVGVGLAFGRTLLALFIGIYAGAVVLALGSAGPWAPLRGLWDVFAIFLRRELFDSFRLEIVGFIAALIAMVGVITRAGGLHGLMDRLLRTARTARSALLLTGGMGLVIFFDDYANCVLVGSTMRPITDRLRVAREKLAYVVDSTAAPVAAISLVSTWIAFQVSVFAPQLPDVGIQQSGYAIFLETLPYRFYCLLTLFFVLCVILTGRDFGPMARAERRARSTGALVRPGGRAPISDAASRIEPEPWMPRDWRLAAGPVVLTVGVTAWRIFAEGGGPGLWRRDPGALLSLEGLTPVLLEGSGAGPIFVGGVAGLLAAVFLAASNPGRVAIAAGAAAWVWGDAPSDGDDPGGALTSALRFVVAAVLAGGLARLSRLPTARPFVPVPRLLGAAAGSARTLGFAVVLLFEAWMIGAVCRELSTADYLVALLSEALPAGMLPLLLFALACLVAFATGSSWSTMSILLPNVVGLAAAVGVETPLGALGMVALCISAVLEGAVFGDHCSPISDTTVLSSVATGSDHIDHVLTQAPYAALVAAAALVCGYLPLLWLPGWSPALALACGAVVLLASLLAVGQRAPAALAPSEIVQ
jgi:Na+/H+ antiporter NhaC